MMIGDSISMEAGYSLLRRTCSKRPPTHTTSVQHGGGFGRGGQMASSDNGAAKVRDCIENYTGAFAKAWSVITYNAGLDCDTRVLQTLMLPT